MDYSDTYIEMCERLPQEVKDDFVEIGSCDEDVWTGDTRLLRQDQLQEMIMQKDRPVAYLLNAFLLYCSDLPLTICNAFASFEQLWLAYVMKEKYGKVWDGEGWVNIGGQHGL